MWTTQGRCPQAHRFSNRNRAEQNEKCVTHVVGQKCYPYSRLHTAALGRAGEGLPPEAALAERNPSPGSLARSDLSPQAGRGNGAQSAIREIVTAVKDPGELPPM